MRAKLLSAVITAAMTGPTMAQQAATEGEDSQDNAQLGTMSIYGQPIFHNRTNDINPVLNYDQEYFQRFEPTSAGEMLKRLPGVSVINDVGEFQDPKIRGLPAGYTQVLINGERFPGATNNRTPQVDRIPFGLIERVEIVRSPSAKTDSQGIGGTLNIITKEPADYDGASVTLGGEYAGGLKHLRADHESGTSGRLGFMFGGDVGPTDYIFSANYTERFVSKLQDTAVFEPGNPGPGPSGYGLAEFESQVDTRDTEDTALNFKSTTDLGKTELSLDGFYIGTDRTETENTMTFPRGEGNFGTTDSDSFPFLSKEFRDDPVNVDVDALLGHTVPEETEAQKEDIEQDQWGTTVGAKRQLTDFLSAELRLGALSFEEDRTERTVARVYDSDSGSYDLDGIEGESIDIEDSQYFAKLDFDMAMGSHMDLAYGLHGRMKERETGVQVFEDGSEEANQQSDLEEGVYAAYLEHTYQITDRVTLRHGVRWEQTELSVKGATLEGATESENSSYDHVNPTLSYRYDLTSSDRFYFSGARTIRRPGFNQLEPVTRREEPSDDSDLAGNPDVEPESAWGLDLGYQRNFAAGRGIAGINFFYRDIQDVIDFVDTGKNRNDGEDTFDVRSFDNVGDGEIYGVEADFSAPLTMVGLDRTALFVNGTLLESEVYDEIAQTNREFTRTPEWIYNVGFNQGFGHGWTAGASFKATDEIRDTEAAEITKQKMEPFLEAFVEKRFVGEKVVVRLVGVNLLDRAKIERKWNYGSIQNRIDNNPEDREIESEQRGRTFRLVARIKF